MHDPSLQAHESEIAKLNAAIGKRLVKLDHERFVLRSNRANGHFNAADFSRDHVLGRIRPDWRSWQIRFACLRIVQDHARIQRDDLFRRNEQRIDVDFLDPALFDDQLAEAHQQVFQCGADQSAARPRNPFFSARVNLCSLHQPSRQRAIQRRKAKRAILENFDKISTGTEQQHRTELRIDTAAEYQFVTVSARSSAARSRREMLVGGAFL